MTYSQTSPLIQSKLSLGKVLRNRPSQVPVGEMYLHRLLTVPSLGISMTGARHFEKQADLPAQEPAVLRALPPVAGSSGARWNPDEKTSGEQVRIAHGEQCSQL